MRSSSAAMSFAEGEGDSGFDGDVLGELAEVERALPERERLLRRGEQRRSPLSSPLAAGVAVQEAGEPGPSEPFHGVGAGVTGGEEAQRSLVGEVARRRPPATSARAAPVAHRAAPATSCGAAPGSGAAWSHGAAGRRARGRARRAIPRGAAAEAAPAGASRAGRSWCACGSSRAGPTSAPAARARRVRRGGGTRRRAPPRRCAWAPGSPAPRLSSALARAASPRAA